MELFVLSRFIQYVFLLGSYFLFNKSFPRIFIKKPVGVITRKKIIAITTGAIIEPRNKPNLNQAIFKGVKNFELIKPSAKNNTATKIAHILKELSFNNGHKDIIKNTKKKTKPKLRFELILILDLLNIFISKDVHVSNQYRYLSFYKLKFYNNRLYF